MRRFIVAAAAALACACSWAGDAEIKLSNISVTSADPNFAFVGGSLSIHAGLGGDSVGKSVSFTTWPLSSYASSITTDTGSAGVSYGPNSFDIFGTSHDPNVAFNGSLSLVLNFQATPAATRADRAQMSLSFDLFTALGAEYEEYPAPVQASIRRGTFDINPVAGQDQELWNVFGLFMGGDGTYGKPGEETLTSTSREYTRTRSISGYTGSFDDNGMASVEFFFDGISGRGAMNPITAPIPEPSTYTLMAAGLGMLAFVARRRVAAARQVGRFQ